jgi:hypothetical protein
VIAVMMKQMATSSVSDHLRALLLAPLLACATRESADFVLDDFTEYNRRDWRHWIDEDRDCQDARQETLIAESRIPVSYTDEKQCRVLAGEWLDPYTNKVFTDPGDLDVDHMVALRDAHYSGGYAWDAGFKKLYANDLNNPDHLVAVSASANRSKGSRGPDEWLPPYAPYRCAYIEAWVGVKENWELTMEEGEAAAIGVMRAVCRESCVPPLPQG